MVKPFLYAACDTEYFKRHGYAFYKSAVQNGHRVFVDISPRNKTITKEDVQFFTDFSNSFTDLEKELAVVPRIATGRYDLNVLEERAYFACVRFLNIDEILLKMNNVLVLDIDSIIMSEIEVDDSNPIGLYSRPNESSGMNVAAGAVFYKDLASTKEFIMETSEFIKHNPVKWFIDQYALFHAHNKCNIEYTDLSKTRLLDWDFQENTMIWTGKGARKDTNMTYLQKKREIDATFLNNQTKA